MVKGRGPTTAPPVGVAVPGSTGSSVQDRRCRDPYLTTVDETALGILSEAGAGVKASSLLYHPGAAVSSTGMDMDELAFVLDSLRYQ